MNLRDQMERIKQLKILHSEMHQKYDEMINNPNLSNETLNEEFQNLTNLKEKIRVLQEKAKKADK